MAATSVSATPAIGQTSDAVTLLDDDKLLLSTTNGFYLDPLITAGHELFTFEPTSLGAKTEGSFSDVDGKPFFRK